jgi:hypothetical protein
VPMQGQPVLQAARQSYRVMKPEKLSLTSVRNETAGHKHCQGLQGWQNKTRLDGQPDMTWLGTAASTNCHQ